MPESQTVPQLPQFIGSVGVPAVQVGAPDDVVDETDDVVLDGIVEVELVGSGDEVLNEADEVVLERTVEFVKGGKDGDVFDEDDKVIVELVKITVAVVAGTVTVKLPPVTPMQLQALEYLTRSSQALA